MCIRDSLMPPAGKCTQHKPGMLRILGLTQHAPSADHHRIGTQNPAALAAAPADIQRLAQGQLPSRKLRRKCRIAVLVVSGGYTAKGDPQPAQQLAPPW